MTIAEALEQAVGHHQAGRLAEAQTLYRAVLAQQPGHADALHLLGVLSHQAGQNDAAIELIRRAIAINPKSAQYLGNLGLVLAAQGKTEEAIAAYQEGIALNQGFAELPYNLGIAFYGQEKLDAAIEQFRAALALRPEYPEALNNLGNPYFDRGQFEQAAELYRRAIALRASYPEAHNNLGTALFQLGRLSDAVACFQKAIELRPEYADAFNNLGEAYYRQNKPHEAIAAFAKVLSISPNSPEALNNLGNTLKDSGRLDEAIECFKKALEVKPDFKLAHNNLGVALKDRGELDKAIACYDRALELDDGYASARSNRIYTMHYHPAFDTPAICAELAKWNRIHASPLARFIQPHGNDRDPDRRLRIGYVSPDFRQHVVGWNLLPLLSRHDHGQFEIYCYSSVLHQDAMTDKLKSHADVWRNMVGVSDEQAATIIRSDKVDILVDLSLHSAQNRLLLFARKPSPVQVTYLGYCSSTGLSAIDYRFSDPYLDPPEVVAPYAETTVRLPRSYWCYQPGGEAPDPGPLPALANGYITLGCMNNFAKVSQPALELWAKILAAIPGARLILHSQWGSHRNRVLETFGAAGVAAGRVEFIAKQHFPKYIQTYLRMDIALDPFPYGGGITTCDALWMGLPVVTLAGNTAVGRAGTSILHNLGQPDWVGRSAEEYQRIVMKLSGDLGALSMLRAGLRSRMQSSPLMDAAAFAGDVETAYRDIWRRHCELPAS